ncbi:MAG: DUF1631 family protein [Pseudomonadota bacterium]
MTEHAQSSSHQEELSRELSARMVERVTRCVSAVFGQVVAATPQALADKGGADSETDEKTEQAPEESPASEAARIMYTSQDAILNAFTQALSQAVRRPAGSSNERKDWSGELELVSDEDMEIGVTVATLSQRINNRAGAEIQALRIRMESISGDGGVGALTPETIFDTLETCLRQASMSFASRQVIFDAFQRNNVQALADIYTESNRWLVERGVMPRIPIHNGKRAPRPQSENPPTPQTPNAEPPPQDESGLRSFGYTPNGASANGAVQAPYPGGVPSPHGFATPAHGFATPAHGFATPAHGFATPAHGFATPAHGFATPAHGFHAQGAQAQFVPGGMPPQAYPQPTVSPQPGMEPFPDLPPLNDMLPGAASFAPPLLNARVEALPAHLIAPWLGQGFASFEGMQGAALPPTLSRVSPMLAQYAYQDPSLMHDRRHPVRRAMNMISAITSDLADREEEFNDISEEIGRVLHSMESPDAARPDFWQQVLGYLDYLKGEIQRRAWSGDDDYSRHVSTARKLAARQIQTQMRGKRATPALHRLLSHLMGPALAILLLRHRNEGDSAVVRNTFALLAELIESVQEIPSSIEIMHYLEHASGSALIRRTKAFLTAFHGLDGQLAQETLAALHEEHRVILDAIMARNQVTLLPVFDQTTGERKEETLQAPLADEEDEDEIALPPSTDEESPATAQGIEDGAPAAASGESAERPETPPPLETTTARPEWSEPDLNVLHDQTAHALLDRLARDFPFSWFRLQICEDSPPRRLMLGGYDGDKRILTFVNVHQEPIIMLSIVDFDSSLRSGATRAIFDDPALRALLEEYMRIRRQQGDTVAPTYTQA